MKKVVFLIFLIMSTLNLFAQQAAVLDSKSMTIPRYANLAALTTAITTPQTGMMVYNIETQSYWYYNGAWTNLASGASGGQWTTVGNNIFNNNRISTNNGTSIYSSAALNVAIPDNNVAGVTNEIYPFWETSNIVNADVVSISIILNHPFAGDLVITLIDPNGDSHILMNRLGADTPSSPGWAASFVSSNVITFNRVASGQIINPGSASIPAGTYLPSSGSAFTVGNLADIYGKQLNGSWKLKVQDLISSNTGTFVQWSITFGPSSKAELGKVAIGNLLEVGGKIKTQNLEIASNLQITKSASLNKVLTSDATGNATWQNPQIPTTLTPIKVQFPSTIVNRKLVLYDTNDNDNQYYGFGINGGVLRYQTDAIAADHVFYSAVNNTTSNELFRIRGNGSALLAGALTQNSDVRLKKNIKPLGNTFGKISQISGYSYNWIDPSRDSDVQIGLLAQEIELIYPEMVKTDANGMKSVNYMALTPVLIEAIKELGARLQKIENQMNTLINVSSASVK